MHFHTPTVFLFAAAALVFTPVLATDKFDPPYDRGVSSRGNGVRWNLEAYSTPPQICESQNNHCLLSKGSVLACSSGRVSRHNCSGGMHND
jgi:hypothetical protein